jgi:fatty acid amide hydrolase 2
VTDYRSIDLSGRRLLIPKFFRSSPVRRDVAATIESAAAALRDVGMVEQRFALPLGKVRLESAGILCREWLPGFRTVLGGGTRISLWEELVAHYRRTPRISRACVTLLAISFFAPMLTGLGYGRFEKMKELRSLIQQSIGGGNILMWPVFPTPAPKHGFAWKPDKGSNYTLVFNCLGFPAMAVPIGLSKEGIPLSVQLVGQANEDETVLAVAAALERAFGGWKRPPIS